MKKLWKIIGITLGSIVGFAVVAIAVALWCVFTPERLTPVVRQIVDPYVTCEWDIDEVEPTFFSTFPEFGLKVSGLRLINPMPDAQSDTVLVAPCVVAKVDVMEYVRNNTLRIRELSIQHIRANVYIHADGRCNADVFYSAPDTIQNDTTAFRLPFDTIVVNRCIIEAQQLSFLDRKDSIDVRLNDTQLKLQMAGWRDMRLLASMNIAHFRMKGEEYAKNMDLRIDLPMELDLNTMYIALHQAELALNAYALSIDGNMSIGDTIPIDLRVRTQDWPIQPLLALLPNSIHQSLTDIDMDGLLSLDIKAKGEYAEGKMPIMDAHVQLKDGQGAYAALPYTFRQIELDANAHLDMNALERSQAQIHHLSARTKNSRLILQGTMKDMLHTMQTQAQVQIDANLMDWAYFLPDSMQATGQVRGEVEVSATLADLMNARLNSVAAKGHLHVQDLHWATDSLNATMEQAAITMDAQLSEWPIVNADIAIASTGQSRVRADSLDAQVQDLELHAHVQMDTQDTTQIPTFNTQVKWKELEGYYKNYSGRLDISQLEAKMTSSRRSQLIPVFEATLSSNGIDAKADENHLQVQSIDLNAKALYRKNQDQFLLKWNPILTFYLNDAEMDVEGFEQHISVPQILFKYSNREFNIVSSSIVLGKSDFTLSGQIQHIGKWLAKKEKLTGELNFVSQHTDVNELMALFSADAGSEEEETTTTTTTTTTTEREPFLVPRDVDLTLNTNIQEADIMNQRLKNLGGKMYIQDGTLVLQEMGFVCDAAKLQLTALYRTPLRDHIYVGLDYHMLDVKIDQLISMIPQIDSMVPMLKSFKGDAEFHLAAETYLNDQYELKTSTLRGAASIFGKDLVVMDSETFDKISKLLSFKKKTENKVDSISAEITVYKDEIDVYPFTVSIDNYMAALGGHHNLDMSFDYHVNLLSPIYVGVDITGNVDNLNIKPAKCIYAKDFKPILHHQVDTRNNELRQRIRSALRTNVKIQ